MWFDLLESQRTPGRSLPQQVSLHARDGQEIRWIRWNVVRSRDFPLRYQTSRLQTSCLGRGDGLVGFIKSVECEAYVKDNNDSYCSTIGCESDTKLQACLCHQRLISKAKGYRNQTGCSDQRYDPVRASTSRTSFEPCFIVQHSASDSRQSSQWRIRRQFLFAVRAWRKVLLMITPHWIRQPILEATQTDACLRVLCVIFERL